MYVYNVPQPTRILTSLGKRGREYETCSHRAIHTLLPALGRPEISFFSGSLKWDAWVEGKQEQERTTFVEWILGGIHTCCIIGGNGFWGVLYRAEDFRSYPPTGLLITVINTYGIFYTVCVCVCVFFPFILDFNGRTSRGHTGRR